MNDEAPLTITVPEAGKKYFNLSRDASYAAAQRGDIPTIRWAVCCASQLPQWIANSNRRGGHELAEDRRFRARRDEKA